MLVGERIRLFPTREQEQQFRQFSGVARFIYNWSLDQRIQYYNETGESLTLTDLLKLYQDLKYSTEYEWLQDTPEAISKQSIKDMLKAFSLFHKRGNKGFPRFKKKSKTKLSFYQRTDNLRLIDSTHIKITGITTPVRVRETELPVQVLNSRVTYDNKYWYLTYSYEVQEQSLSMSGNIIGIDLGIKNLAVCSDGAIYKNINKTSKRIKKLEKKLKHTQRRLSKRYLTKHTKSNNTLKLENKLRLLHRSITNIRTTYLHEVTMFIVKTKPYAIVIEDLNIRGMMKNKHLSDAIGKQGWYKFREFLTYKCTFYGVRLLVAERTFPSSRLTSCCHHKLTNLKLSDREITCPVCRQTIDRDYNASLNLAQWGKDKLGLTG